MSSKTPIVDFVKSYIDKDISRLHMPGHKGRTYLGCEVYDITEICGADVLYSADGIIQKSEEKASSLFRTEHTFYSTEGSSLAIKAMLALVSEKNDDGYILAGRNAHKSFIYACALLDLKVEWICPDSISHLCSCNITATNIRSVLKKAEKLPYAIYLTSPDYLGNILDIEKISKVCDEFNIPLVVDNAHGAYLAFCEPSMHPIDLGATMCCDSAHKTLPVLTGGAYLHISKKADRKYIEKARQKLSLFASTSPSYLILQSLDMCNKILAEDYNRRIKSCVDKIINIKQRLFERGVAVCLSEPLKLVINAKKMGYIGTDLADRLRKDKLEFEFYDDDFIVAMFTPDNNDIDFERLVKAFEKIDIKTSLECDNFFSSKPSKKTEIRQAIFGESETIEVENAEGRVCASPLVACPPAVPVVMSGEMIEKNEIVLLKKYGIKKIEVLKSIF